jgi:hypothetical protein
MTKNLEVSDSNSILKTIIIVLIVAGIAYVIYYLYNKNQGNDNTKMNEIVYNSQALEESIYTNSNNLPKDIYEENKASISSVKTRMTGSASGQSDPIMNKKEFLRKGKVVGSEAIEHFSADENYKVERNLTSFPKDQLTAEELLPQDNSSLWAQVNPSGEGSLKDRNFLQSGYHIGINTVGQTLRNANLQLRSEPPCPQVRVSPWLQATIEPDVSRKPFEIGGCQ